VKIKFSALVAFVVFMGCIGYASAADRSSSSLTSTKDEAVSIDASCSKTGRCPACCKNCGKKDEDCSPCDREKGNDKR
jgi:hypothetical protein